MTQGSLNRDTLKVGTHATVPTVYKYKCTVLSYPKS